MGAAWQDIGRTVGRAAGAVLATLHVREGGAWRGSGWADDALADCLPEGWLPASPVAVEDPASAGREPTVTAPLAGLADEHAALSELEQQVTHGLALPLDLWRGERALLWLGFAGAPDGERVERARELLESSCCRVSCDYRRFIDAVPALFVAVGADGRIRRCNDRIEQLGYTREALPGSPAEQLFAPGEWSRVVRTLEGDPQARQIKTLLRRGGGEVVAADIMASALPGAEGAPGREVLLLVHDLREQPRLDRFRRLEAVERLVSGVAHELNNPLQTVVGNAEMLAGMKLSEAAQRRARRVLSGARRCQEVVDGLLKLKSRPREATGAVDVADLVQRALRQVAAEFEHLTVATRFEQPPDPPTIRGNAGDLAQALASVVRNAYQAVARCAEPRVAVQLSRSGQTVQLTVEDNGPGLEPEILERAFEPFFTTRGVGAGKGLGLSIALGIVEEHGGLIELQSIEPTGARVTITLPIAGPRAF